MKEEQDFFSEFDKDGRILKTIVFAFAIVFGFIIMSVLCYSPEKNNEGKCAICGLESNLINTNIGDYGIFLCNNCAEELKTNISLKIVKKNQEK